MLTRRLRDLPIRAKLYALIGILAADLVGVITLGALGLSTLSSLRAYVGGEGLWAKAQKDAILSLHAYARSRDQEDYDAFLKDLEIPLGDRQGREELEKARPDFAAARAGYLAGGNHPDDVPGAITLFRRFRHVGYMRRAIELWAQGDEIFAELRRSAEGLHRAVASGAPRAAVDRRLAQIDRINAQLTALEIQFSATLGEASRGAARGLLWAMVLGSALSGALSVAVALLISRAITRGVGEISRSAARAARGDLSARARVEGADELGRLAASFNRMIEELSKLDSMKSEFVWNVSHDLQQPLNKIATFTEFAQHSLGSDGVGKTRDLLRRIASSAAGMRALIEGLLSYSRAGRGELRPQVVETRTALDQALENLEAEIAASGAAVTAGALPALPADATQLVQLFQNLVSNAIKFRGERPPAVRVQAQRQNGEWIFSVKDDGIGIAPRDRERAFALFARVHAKGDYPGHGIGLAICKKIVDRHGGRIWVESEPGKGAAFFFALPAAH